jgi:hypothetical protein
MTRLLILASMLFASAVFAQVEIPHVHENGDVIDADEINQNLDIVAKAVPPRDCSTDQIIKWDGLAWVCSSLTRVVSTAAGVIPCPSGKKVTGGGCQIRMRDCHDTFSEPMSDLSGWYCSASAPRGEDCEVTWGYAICQ